MNTIRKSNLAFSEGWMGCPSATQWGVQSFGRGSEWSPYSSTPAKAVASWARCFSRACQLDPEHTEEIASINWPGKGSGFPRISWRRWVRGRPELSSFGCFPAAWHQISGRKPWMIYWSVISDFNFYWSGFNEVSYIIHKAWLNVLHFLLAVQFFGCRFVIF